MAPGSSSVVHSVVKRWRMVVIRGTMGSPPAQQAFLTLIHTGDA
jgi:hypothetical protein